MAQGWRFSGRLASPASNPQQHDARDNQASLRRHANTRGFLLGGEYGTTARQGVFYWYVCAMLAIPFLVSLRLPRDSRYLN